MHRRTIRPIVASLCGVAGLLTLAAVIKMCPASSSTGDSASLSLHTLAALKGQAQVGPYSQYGWNHPGPLLFYIMAPLYYLTDYHEMSHRVTALIINAACVWGIVVVGRRYDPVVAVLAVLGIVLIEWRAGGDLAFSAWNPHVTLLPLALLVFVAAAIAAGSTSLLPLGVLIASFIAQSHLGFVPLSVALVVLPVIAAVGHGHRLKPRVLYACAVLAMLLWLPSLLEEVNGEPGNLSHIARFMAGEQHTPRTVHDPFRLFSTYYLLSVSGDMRLPVGWKAAVAHSDWIVVLAAFVLGSVILVAVYSRQRGHQFHAALCVACIVASVIGFLSIYGLRREASDHHVFWLAIPGVFSLAVVCATVVSQWSTRRGWRLTGAGWGLTVALAFFATGGWRLALWQQDAAHNRTTRILYGALTNYIQAHGLKAPVLEHTAATWDQTAGIVLLAAKDGYQIAVHDDLVIVTGKQFKRTGAEDVRLLVFDFQLDRESLRDARGPEIVRSNQYAIAVIAEVAR